MIETSIHTLAHDFAELTDCSIFLTGKAGTGKTTFLKKIREQSNKKIAVVAPTGVAAINAGGTTIHSFFQLPFTPFVPTPEGRKNLISKIKLRGERRRIMQELEMLIIDEISMVRADLLDSIDTVLRHFRYRQNEAFGGVQMIFIGDMHQLSPVVTESEAQLLSEYYEGQYFFQSRVIQQSPPIYIEFDKIFRQSNTNFIQLLNEVRNNTLSLESRELIKSRYIPNFRPTKKDGYITLTTHNAKADNINKSELAKIKEKTYKFNAKIDGDFSEKSYPNEAVLELKKGALVMFIANDKQNPRRYYNGKIGEICEISDDKIFVACDDENPIEVILETWENVRYNVDKKTNNITEETLGTYTQYPLRLAWAITIHKSQGLTFDKVVIDSDAAFAAGQIYVALSRCRTLEGMVLSSPINERMLAVDTHIAQHSNQKLPVAELGNKIEKIKHLYNKKILKSIFDFSSIAGEIKDLADEVKNVAESFNSETSIFLNNIFSQTAELNNVANRFGMQIEQLFAQNNTNELKERIAAASDYFTAQLNNLNQLVQQSPAITDSRQNAKEYSERLQTIFSHIAYKIHVIEGIRNNFSVENYFVVKSEFKVPPIAISAYAGDKDYIAKSDVANPLLFKHLLMLRRELCVDSDLPVYMIASTKTLTDMSEFLPQTPEELMRIKGFGKIKTQKFGDIFLETINDYCHKNNLKSRMSEAGSKVKKTREKKEKVDTKLITFGMHCQGKTIDDIATERKLTKSTIENHLAHYIAKGELQITDFFPQDIIDKVSKLLHEKKGITEIYKTFKGEISYGNITMIRAAI